MWYNKKYKDHYQTDSGWLRTWCVMHQNFRYFWEVVHTGNTSMEKSGLIVLEITGIAVTVISIIVTIISIVQTFRHEKSNRHSDQEE